VSAGRRRLGWRSAGARDGLILSAAMILAGALDYLVNVLAGRRLDPVEFGVFISVMAIIQVVTLLAIAIRMVVAFYTAESAVHGGPGAGALVHHVWSWSWRWGLLATGIMALSSPLLAHALRLPDAWPLWAATPIVMVLFLREAAFGTFQGLQAFGALGILQVVQAALRVVLTGAVLLAGSAAAGVIGAQALAGFGCVAAAAWWLRSRSRAVPGRVQRQVSWHYSISTVGGLALFGLLSNSDALFVRHFFSPEVAGDYGPVVTLAKVSLFLPWAIGLVLFPKVARRRAQGRDPRPLLLVALAAALAPGLAITAVYLAVPGLLVRTVFTGAYPDPGIALGLASLAATLFAGVHIWLNYALSLEQKAYVYVLAGILLFQALGMYLFGRDGVVQMTLVMVTTGLAANVAGYATTWSCNLARASPGEAVGS
jgi:O-antigen/teichoic acid export membrane protein